MPSQTKKSPFIPFASFSICGARSRYRASMRVVHTSAGSTTWESAERTCCCAIDPSFDEYAEWNVALERRRVKEKREPLICPHDVNRFILVVMPAKAGTQEKYAVAYGDASWIPATSRIYMDDVLLHLPILKLKQLQRL